MCGIGLLLSFSEQTNHLKNRSEWNELLSETISSRGPDLPRQMCHYEIRDASLTLHGSVLHMRGVSPSAQPLLFSLGEYMQYKCCSDETLKQHLACRDECALCWNGECYTYHASNDSDNEKIEYGAMIELVGSADTQREMIDTESDLQYNQHQKQEIEPSYDGSDAILVKNLLLKSITKTRKGMINDTISSHDFEHLEHKIVASTMSKIHGEYSFLLYVPPRLASKTWQPEHQNHGFVYFGRDILGRRSLLINRSITGLVILSSVAINSMSKSSSSDEFDNSWEELPPGVVHRMNVCTGEVTSMATPRIVNKGVQSLLSYFQTISVSCVISPIDSAANQQPIDKAAKILLRLLDKSIQRRVMNAPLPKTKCHADASVAVLFSGGIDSVILAALSHRHVPFDRPIDLINVAFYDDSHSNSSTVSPDRLAALVSYCEMCAKWPEQNWRFIAVDVSYGEVLNVESKILGLMRPLDSTMDFNIAVAFWFAARANGRVISPLDANQYIQKVNSQSAMAVSLQEPLLRFAQPNESTTHNCISKPTQNVSRMRSVCTRGGCERLAPSSGCVFRVCKFCCGKLQSPISKFAGQRAHICPVHNWNVKKNICAENSHARLQSFDNFPTSNRTTSAAKILLSGVGADEQMAGYGRHRSTFQRGGYSELKKELQMEVRRLWTRNLGRDDRCLSDCGKEARFPYLDEDVVAYLELLPLEFKCNLDLPQGEGDKLILRKVARLIGVNECSALVKRAIQFGSRIAKVSDKNRFGSQRQACGEAKHLKKIPQTERQRQ